MSAVLLLAVAAAVAPPQAVREAERLYRLTVTHTERGDYELAARTATQALDAARASGDPALEARARGCVGDAHYYRAEYPQALEAYARARAVFLELGREVDAANQLRNEGVALRDAGRFEEAAQALRAAAATLRAAGEVEDTASALANLGRVYLRLGDATRAFEAATESVALARRLGEGLPLAHALLRLATVYLENDFPEAALEVLRPADAIFEREGAASDRSWVLSLFGAALSDLGRLDEAIEAEERAYALARDRVPSGGADNLARLGNLHLERDPALARDLLERARGELERRAFPVRWDLLAALGRARAATGDLDGAIELHRAAIEDLESARSLIVSDRYRASHLRRHRSLHRDAVALLWERERRDRGGADAAAAFEIAERSRGLDLAEAMRESGAGRDSSGTGEREASIRAEIAALERRLLEPGRDRAGREAILDAIDRLESDLALAVAELRRRDPGRAALLYPDPVSAEEARASLDGTTTLVAYVEGRGHLYAFVLARDRLRFVRLEASPERVAARVRNFLDLLEDDDGAAALPVARRLHEELVAPLGGEIPAGTERLVVVPDGTLSFLPFETLHDGSRFLVERFDVAYAPSATVLRELRRRAGSAPPSRADLLMFANPDPPVPAGAGAASSAVRSIYESEGLAIPPLPYAGVEARRVRPLVDGESRIYVGAEASERALKSSPLDGFRVVHFATHGLVSRSRPGRSSLLLAADAEGVDDGLLTIPEICDLPLKSELVVLAACRTARGPTLEGDGVHGLARAFLHAGSRSVLASLWDVDDAGTADLVARFYREIAAGKSKAAALREAKLAMIRDPKRSAPRHWAGFVLSGDAEGAITLAGPRRSTAVIAAAAVLAALAAAMLLLRRKRPLAGGA